MPTPYPLLQQRLHAPDGKGRHRTRRSPSPCQIRSRTRPLWCSPRSPAPTRPPATAALLLLLWVDTGLVPEATARGYGPKLSPEAVARVGQEARLAPAGLAHKLRLLERGVGQLGAERIHNCRSKEYVAASLREQGVPFVVLEREDCIASLWQKRTYDRLKIHLPKQFCQLPRMPFPADYPKYPTRRQFIQYLETYAATFDVKHEFGSTVQSARYDETSSLWRVHSSSAGAGEMEYIGRWLVVATGENAERVIPDILDLDGFAGEVAHVSNYKSGEKYRGKSVLVVGCGNSGMEVSLDLCDHGALPSMVVRDAVHMLPREVCGRSTFELWFVDKLMVFFAWIILGNLTSFGIRRPTIGPLTLKNTHGRTPVLDTGAIQD